MNVSAGADTLRNIVKVGALLVSTPTNSFAIIVVAGLSEIQLGVKAARELEIERRD